MRTLAIALTVAFTTPAFAADKDEDKAKEAAVAFMKAVKAKDLDALMKTVDVPFLMTVAKEPKVLEKTDEVKAELKMALEKLADTERVPTEVLEVLDAPALRKKLEGKKDADVIKMVEKVLGEKGYAVVVGKEGASRGAVLVRIKDGKAVVVGLPR
jgi:hypothetical protein